MIPLRERERGREDTLKRGSLGKEKAKGLTDTLMASSPVTLGYKSDTGGKKIK